jgi:RNA polymerase sigma-70 factor (ECF subfamily)
MTERMLVQRASHGDLDAFEELVRRYQSAAIAYAFSILNDYHAAEDAAQEAFVAMWRHFDSVRDPGSRAGSDAWCSPGAIGSSGEKPS